MTRREAAERLVDDLREHVFLCGALPEVMAVIDAAFREREIAAIYEVMGAVSLALPEIVGPLIEQRRKEGE